MRVIPFNVNVMDANGTIIGSGNASRIGTRHAGAQLVLAQHGTMEIDIAAAGCLQGVEPGINLPLTVRGETCGVVGITGEPDQVRQFAELVRVNAEMILEQALLITELQREKRYKEEFLHQLVTRANLTHADLEAWALRLNVNFHQPRAVLILTLTDDGLPPEAAHVQLQRCQNFLSAQRPELLSATTSHRELVILDVSDHGAGAASRPALPPQRLAELWTALNGVLETPSALAMGVALPGIEGIAFSYQSARSTLRIGLGRRPRETVFSYYDYSLPVLLAGLSGWQADQLRQPMERLASFDKRSGVLRRTLYMWFAQSEHPNATAKALYIHRNTLDYRLRQIGEITGLDLAKSDDRLLLYISLQLSMR